MKNIQRKAFSLMELMIVIIILGILAGLVMPNLFSKSNEAKQKLVCIQMKNISTELQDFRSRLGSYPTTEEGLSALVSNPDPEKYKENSYPTGGFFADGHEPKDSWGNAFIYILDENNNFELISLGADGKEGGKDADKDIKLSECKAN